MIKAIFYKEYIKSRWYLLLALLATLGLTGFLMLRISRAIALKGADHIWQNMILKDAVFVNLLEYVPLLVGILLAIVQFTPEMQRKCLKLTLHLPCSQKKMLFAMLGFGVLALTVCFATNFMVMGICLPIHFAHELVRHILLTALPWYIAGYAGYLLLAWVCLEPTWKMRIFNLIVSVLIFRVFFLAPAGEAYNSFLPWLILYTLLTSCLSWISVTRFKEGKQD